MQTLITRAVTFDAAHRLDWHPGKCRNLHGHTYRVEVSVEGPVGVNGVVTDFDHLREVLARVVVARYDHTFLNDLLANPTAELLAADIWARIEADGLGPAISLARLRLWETPNSSVELTA